MGKDPIALPFNYVDTSALDAMIAVLKEEKGLDACQENELNELSSRLKNQVLVQGDACETCKGYIATIARIGVISRPQGNADAEEKRKYNVRLKERKQATDRLHVHLSDDSLREVHKGLSMKGWWTEWLKRRIPLIAAHYASRSIKSSVAASNQGGGEEVCRGLVQHPFDRTVEESYKYDRVQNICFTLNKDPGIGDMVVVRYERDDVMKPPFGLGIIRAYRNPSDEDLELEKSVKAVANDILEGKRKQTFPPFPSGLNLTSKRRAEEASSKNTGYRKDAMAPMIISADVLFRHSHVLVDWIVHQEPKKKRKTYGTKRKGKRKKPSAPQKLSEQLRKKIKADNMLTSQDSGNGLEEEKNGEENQEQEEEEEDEDDDEEVLEDEEKEQEQDGECAEKGNSEGKEEDDKWIPENSSAPDATHDRGISLGLNHPKRAISFVPMTAAEVEKFRSLSYMPEFYLGKDPATLRGLELTSYRRNLSYERWMPVSSLVWWSKESFLTPKNKTIEKDTWNYIMQDLTTARDTN